MGVFTGYPLVLAPNLNVAVRIAEYATEEYEETSMLLATTKHPTLKGLKLTKAYCAESVIGTPAFETVIVNLAKSSAPDAIIVEGC